MLKITIEGKFASGKTTMASEIADYLEKLGFTVVLDDDDNSRSRDLVADHAFKNILRHDRKILIKTKIRRTEPRMK
jgi:adenylylsulfate kinase-like enzyme